MVAPLVGAWIEIRCRISPRRSGCVAPLVGAWIEIAFPLSRHTEPVVSLPLWERGLKSTMAMLDQILQAVAPLVGAWIEIRQIM